MEYNYNNTFKDSLAAIRNKIMNLDKPIEQLKHDLLDINIAIQSIRIDMQDLLKEEG